MAFICNDAFSDADATARNKCRNGKRYKAKAKVNGPNGCARTVIRDNNCQGVNTGLLVLYKSPNNCDCLGPDANLLNPVGSSSRAISQPGEVSTYAYKFGGCRRYRAGGEMNMINDANFQNLNTGVESLTSFRDFTVDYNLGKLVLNNFGAKLKIESPDIVNEFSLFQIVVNAIKINENGVENISQLLTSEVYFQNGKVNFYGKNIFKLSDFEKVNLVNGYSLTLQNTNFNIELGNPIDTSMIIEVSLKGDVGNILAGNSLLHQFDYTVVPSLNQETNHYQVIIDSEEDKSLKLIVKDLNAQNLLEIENIDIVAGERKIIILDDNLFLNSHDEIFLLQTESDDGYIQNSVIINPH